MVHPRLGSWYWPLIVAVRVTESRADASNRSEQALVGCDWFGDNAQYGCSKVNRGLAKPHEECMFSGYRYPAIGMKRVDLTDDDHATLNGLMWSQGTTPDLFVHNGGRHFYSPEWLSEIYTEFFLSWPSQPSDRVYPKTCAVIFEEITPPLKFPGYDDDPAASTGTCSDAMDQSCIDGLLDFVNDIAKTSNSTDVCSDIEESLSDLMDRSESLRGVPPGCFNGGKPSFSYGEFRAHRIRYESEVALMNEQQKEGGGCIPSFWSGYEPGMIQPGNEVFTQYEFRPSTWINATFGITPALTVSWREPENEGKPRKVGSTLTCMKLVDPNHSFNAAIHHKSSGKRESAVPAMLTMALGLVVSMVMVW